MRETSLEAWRAINEGNIVVKLQRRVYNYLFEYGPATQAETEAALIKQHPGHWTAATYGPRFAQLERKGVIRIIGQKPNPITRRNNFLWDVTSHTPERQTIKKNKPKKIWVDPACVPSLWVSEKETPGWLQFKEIIKTK